MNENFSGSILSKAEKIRIAKVVLQKLFEYPEAANGINVKTILLIGRDNGLNKSEMKAARKELGVISENRDGIWLWKLTKEGQRQ